MKFGQEWTILKLEEHVSGVNAAKCKTELTQVNVPRSDLGKEEVQGPNVEEDEVVEAVEYVGRFSLDLTVYQQD